MRRMLAVALCSAVAMFGMISVASASTNSVTLSGVKQTVAQYSAAPTSIGIHVPLTKRPPTGLTIVNAIPGAPVGQIMAQGIASAASALGWHVVDVNMGATAQTTTAAWTQIANMNPLPTAVIEEGVDTTGFSSQLAFLKSHNVPVVAVSIPTYPLITGASSGVVANIQDPSFQVLNGKVTADYVIDKFGTSVHNLFAWIPDYNFYVPFVAEYQKQFKVCEPKCSVNTLTLSGTSIGTTAASTIVNYLRAHPSINTVTGAFGDILIGLPAALQQAGLHVKLVSTGGEAATLQYIKSGEQQMTLGIPLLELGWNAMDVIARHVVGDSLQADAYPLPIQFLTAKQLTFNIQTQQWPGVANYESTFKKLWRIS
jgi:ABC-type sugar transport system substrate-binding protein